MDAKKSWTSAETQGILIGCGLTLIILAVAAVMLKKEIQAWVNTLFG